MRAWDNRWKLSWCYTRNSARILSWYKTWNNKFDKSNLKIKTREKKKNERKKNYKLKGIKKRKKSREVPLKMDAAKAGKSRGKPGEHRRKEK